MDAIMHTNIPIPYTHINLAGINQFANGRKIEHPYYDKVCEKVLELKYTGYKALERNDWKPSKKYDRKLLEKIGARKLFFNEHYNLLHLGSVDISDFLIELETMGKSLSNCPERITQQNYKQMRLRRNKTDNVISDNYDEGPIESIAFEIEYNFDEDN
jgi:hypothetical protein